MARDTEKEVIRTIYHEDVSAFFEVLGLLEKIARAEIRCAVCGQPISLENFKAVTNKSGKLLFCCNQEACIEGFGSCLTGGKT
jgi:hypothetical protein